MESAYITMSLHLSEVSELQLPCGEGPVLRAEHGYEPVRVTTHENFNGSPSIVPDVSDPRRAIKSGDFGQFEGDSKRTF